MSLQLEWYLFGLLWGCCSPVGKMASINRVTGSVAGLGWAPCVLEQCQSGGPWVRICWLDYMESNTFDWMFPGVAVIVDDDVWKEAEEENWTNMQPSCGPSHELMILTALKVNYSFLYAVADIHWNATLILLTTTCYCNVFNRLHWESLNPFSSQVLLLVTLPIAVVAHHHIAVLSRCVFSVQVNSSCVA